jgi:hypothetical protein
MHPITNVQVEGRVTVVLALNVLLSFGGKLPIGVDTVGCDPGVTLGSALELRKSHVIKRCVIRSRS